MEHPKKDSVLAPDSALPELKAAPFLALVVPCYNEEAILPHTIAALAKLLADCKERGLINGRSFALYVDDGSKDATWQILESRHQVDPFVKGVKFAANAGHQNAVWAGMATARDLGVDCVISLDADLQDDIAVIPQMLACYAEGAEIVFGVRSSRGEDSFFKRHTAHLFYALMRFLKIRMIPEHADFRLVARAPLEALRAYGEQTLFLRGLFPILGFKTARVYYERLSRKAGETKYPLRKMLSFAWRGISSCSAAPLRISGMLGLLCMLVALLFCIVSLCKYISGETVQGWTSLIIVILLLGSVQLICLAVIGEYIAKIFDEVRARPRYIVEKTL